MLNKSNYVHRCDEEINNFGQLIIPFLHPFAVEYNLILVGVWFLQWIRINDDSTAEESQNSVKGIFMKPSRTSLSTLRRKFRTSAVSFQIDCHSAHRALFLGIVILFLTLGGIVSFVLFNQHEDTKALGYNINSGIELLLQGSSVIVLFIAYFQISKLKVGRMNQAIFLDNLLLLSPLPFLFFGSLIPMVAEVYFYNSLGVAVQCLQMIEVMIQTPFLTDALRRHSPSKKLQEMKPGRQLVTILIATNLSLWILGNVNIIYFHLNHSAEDFYGHFLWTILIRMTLPFTLFYRFHSMVCLADIWKSAYENED